MSFSPPPTFSGAIFDLDGTLLDTESLLDECAAEALHSLTGITAPASALNAVRGLADHGEGGWPARLLAEVRCTGAATGDALFAATDAIFVARVRDGGVPLMRGAAAAVAALAAARVPLAIATSSMRPALALKRARHERGVFEHFSAAVCVEDVAPRSKPAPDAFTAAAEPGALAAGAQPGACDALAATGYGRSRFKFRRCRDDRSHAPRCARGHGAAGRRAAAHTGGPAGLGRAGGLHLGP
jgi:beta-phosphoglucomutase-like phosphatase (HAD superfamily)